jgi:hypothetical protein
MHVPRLTTIIAWYRRPELGRTLRHNAPFLTAMDSGVIVVNCGGDPRDLAQLIEGHGGPIRQIDLAAPRFNKSLALNIGIHAARSAALLILDADILLTTSLTSYADGCVVRPGFAVCQSMTQVPPLPVPFAPPSPSLLQRVVSVNTHAYHWSDGTVTEIVRERVDHWSGCTLAPGILLARRADLVDIGGYRSDLVGWGWEDLDVNIRLRRRGLHCAYIDDEIQHLAHGDELRDTDESTNGSRLASAHANRLRVLHAYCEGRFTGTYAADVAASPMA